MVVNAALADCWTERGAVARRAVAIAGIVVAAQVAYGAMTMWRTDRGRDAAGVRVTAVQGNLDLGTQWKPEFYGTNVEAYGQLTARAVSRDGSPIIVWPENALTFFLEKQTTYRAYLSDLLGRLHAELLTGGPRVIHDPTNGTAHFRNAAFVLTPGNEIAGVYEKRHLVPFAEYFPLPRFDFLKREFGRVRQFEPGTLQDPVPTVAGPAGVVICNEAFFGENANDRVKRGATWLVALANDSWVGERRYAQIAFEMTRLRAVETRRWLVRASTSGPTAIVDAAGRVVDQLDAGVQGTASAIVFPVGGITLYTRLGDLFAWGCAAVTLFAVLVPGRYRAR
jgi:apolipoprotein N-acyltransferase